jgi:hypothetical protein
VLWSACSFAWNYEVELIGLWCDLGVGQPPGFCWVEWLSALFWQLFACESGGMMAGELMGVKSDSFVAVLYSQLVTGQ